MHQTHRLTFNTYVFSRTFRVNDHAWSTPLRTICSYEVISTWQFFSWLLLLLPTCRSTKPTQHLNPSWTPPEQLHTASRLHIMIVEGLIRPSSIQTSDRKRNQSVGYVFAFFHWFILGCINVSVLFWSYITQTGRASSSTACWWQTTPSLWEQAFNSMCNQFDGQPLSRALMNTAAVFHTCFYCLCLSAASEVHWNTHR